MVDLVQFIKESYASDPRGMKAGKYNIVHAWTKPNSYELENAVSVTAFDTIEDAKAHIQKSISNAKSGAAGTYDDGTGYVSIERELRGVVVDMWKIVKG